MQEGTAEIGPIQKTITSRLQITPTREINIGAVHLTEFDNKSRLYQFDNNEQLVLYLTPDGVTRMQEMDKRKLNKIKKTGHLDKGKIIDKNRSTVRTHTMVDVVSKASKQEKFDEDNIRRLNELINMVQLSQQIGKINSNVEGEKKIRLETPTYYGYARWQKSPNDIRQVIFMSHIKNPQITDFDLVKDFNVFQDLHVVIEQAKRAGIEFQDLAGNAFVKRNEGRPNTYILIDQA